MSQVAAYNQKSMKKLGWSPEWFGVFSGRDSDLEDAVRRFQRENGLVQDGKVGEVTFRRIYTQHHALEAPSIRITDTEYAVVDFKVDHTYDNSDFKGCYKKYNGRREPIEIVTHWDATLSAKHCIDILLKRKISTHFVIDNDGTIYQLINLNDIAWHASGHNNHTVGIDISNAFYLKYQSYYEKNVGKPRPILRSELHGRDLGEHLGYYEEQLDSYGKLLKFLTNYYDIPSATPEVLGVHPEAAKKEYRGVVSHYHLTKNKIDCAGLDIKKILDKI